MFVCVCAFCGLLWCWVICLFLCVFYVFAWFVCDVLCDGVWFVFCIVFVCVGALSIYLCNALMMNGVLLPGFVLCCCVVARLSLMCVL